MGIKVEVGVQPRGLIYQQDGSYRGTNCVYVAIFPIIPLGGVTVDGEQVHKAPLSLESLCAAYFKTWGFAFTLLLLPGAQRAGGFIALMHFAVLASIIATWFHWGMAPEDRPRYRTWSKRRWAIVAACVSIPLAVLVKNHLHDADAPRRSALRTAWEGMVPKATLADDEVKDFVPVENATTIAAGSAIVIQVMDGYVRATALSSDVQDRVRFTLPPSDLKRDMPIELVRMAPVTKAPASPAVVENEKASAAAPKQNRKPPKQDPRLERARANARR